MANTRLTHDELDAIAMLVGEFPPIVCSCCLGAGTSKGLFGGKYRCMQCNGSGYDIIGTKTMEVIHGRQWPQVRRYTPGEYFTSKSYL